MLWVWCVCVSFPSLALLLFLTLLTLRLVLRHTYKASRQTICPKPPALAPLGAFLGVLLLNLTEEGSVASPSTCLPLALPLLAPAASDQVPSTPVRAMPTLETSLQS